MKTVKTPIEPQCFGDGLVTFYQTKNGAAAGNLPTQVLKEIFKCPFEQRKISDSRYYAALQADAKISKIIRCPRVSGRLQPAGDVAIISGDTNQYRVEKVAESAITTPESMDVTLSIAKQRYEIEEE